MTMSTVMIDVEGLGTVEVTVREEPEGVWCAEADTTHFSSVSFVSCRAYGSAEEEAIENLRGRLLEESTAVPKTEEDEKTRDKFSVKIPEEREDRSFEIVETHTYETDDELPLTISVQYKYDSQTVKMIVFKQEFMFPAPVLESSELWKEDEEGNLLYEDRRHPLVFSVPADELKEPYDTFNTHNTADEEQKWLLGLYTDVFIPNFKKYIVQRAVELRSQYGQAHGQYELRRLVEKAKSGDSLAQRKLEELREEKQREIDTQTKESNLIVAGEGGQVSADAAMSMAKQLNRAGRRAAGAKARRRKRH